MSSVNNTENYYSKYAPKTKYIMKNSFFYYLSISCLSIFIYSCSETEEPIKDPEMPIYQYSMSIKLTTNANAPELQSFAQASSGNEWLLFAGRYNPDSTKNGGLHSIHSVSGSSLNYANHGFPPPSFNETMFVYDVSNDTIVAQKSYVQFVTTLTAWEASANLSAEAKSVCSDLLKAKGLIYQTFRNTNSQAIQEGEYVYVVGGYGTPLDSLKNNGPSYMTFPSVAKIHIPSMISFIKNDEQNVDWNKFFKVGTSPRLQATGGELLKIGDVLYLCGGHNFAYEFLAGMKHNQKYQDAVYAFTLDNDTSLDLAQMKVTILDTITDIKPKKEVLKHSADTISIFRRRDGPIVPALFKNANGLSQGLIFYGGVFKPVKNSSGHLSSPPLAAWNDAICVYNANTGTGPLQSYTSDTAYNQDNWNVYSCPDFSVYDSSVEELHTFLPGGIGNGKSDGNLSAFTNTGVHAVLNVNSKKSKPEFIPAAKVFGEDTIYYGAESVFVPISTQGVQYVTVGSETTPIIDAVNSTWTNNSVEVGYVYGGIEAYLRSPGALQIHGKDTTSRPGYGKGYSGATGKIWKVTLKRTELGNVQ